MYRYSNGQISLSDFKRPVGMNLKENNRWVKKAQTIPWIEFERRYTALLTNRKGNVAKPLRLALGACIIQVEYGYSDEVERCFSLAKHKCGMGLVTARLQETTAHVIAMSIVVLNLRRIQRALLQFLVFSLCRLFPQKMSILIQ